MAITNRALNARFLESRLQLDFANALKTSTARELRLGGQNLQKIVETFADKAFGPDRKKVNEGLAKGMQRAAVTAYEENVLRERVAPSYRTNDRFSGGRLHRALQDPSMAVGTENGIGFINVRLLDTAARQWARLNFGAAPGEGYSGTAAVAPNARIRFGSNQGTNLRLGGGMSAGFNVPQRGVGHFDQNKFFLGFPTGRSRATGRFQSTKKSKRELGVLRERASRGIRPRHFLDQGLVYLAENFGPEYRTYLEDQLRNALANGKRAT